MNELEQNIHDTVHGVHPMNGNQIYQALIDSGTNVTIEEIREAIDNLVKTGFLKDANIPSYFPVK